VKKIKEFKMFALTLNKGMAYDAIKSPVSQRERWGFFFGWIPIRYHNTGNRPCNGKITKILTN
jgi:hypothetical protein